MEDRLSFIPKKAFNPEPRGRKSGLGFFLVFSALIFISSLGLWLGLVFYSKQIDKSNQELNSSLNKRKASFEISSVAEIINISHKISIAAYLVQKHVASSLIFDFLENFTLNDIGYSSFDYSLSAEEGNIVQLAGAAKSYTDIASQDELLKNNTAVKEISLTDFAADKTGLIRFNAKIKLDPSSINYQSTLK